MRWLKPSKFDFSLNEPMKAHTSFRIGGPVDVWIRVRDFDELARIVGFCRGDRTPCMIVGSGNNLLVRDGGIDGVVLQLKGSPFGTLQRIPDGLRVGAGVRLQRLVGECMARGLTGCEFLVAIPGTVGGAVRMNAGTRDETISERIIEVTVLDPDGNIRVLTRDEIPFSYRESGLGNSVVLEVRLRLSPGPRDQVRKRILANFARKQKTQDLQTPSAGSIFKNWSGGLVPSARLIEMSGLKGLRMGGARVSPIHANFIVNDRNARSSDVEELITAIREKVRHDHDITLDLEVHVVGRERHPRAAGRAS